MSNRPALLMLASVAVAGCVHGAPPPARPPAGMLAGIIRDASSGAGVPDALIVVPRAGAGAPIEAHTSHTGTYAIDGLPPGSYHVTAYRDHQPIGDATVLVQAGRVSGFDLVLGNVLVARPDDPTVVPSAPPLWRFHPADADPHAATIEGTVTELGERFRLEGAVVNVADDDGNLVGYAITDEAGRYQVSLPPGDYAVSAYYTLVGRGQFEIRRTQVEVGGGEVVEVPLEIETVPRG
ncbi:MAG TPA: carboxypeptidase-like regulatory domain-containing protein [Kofleriaceae bacterium]|nr:carboxypeptidase-like regulatory domain-containing protein [Kofleriaceae bacterium]